MSRPSLARTLISLAFLVTGPAFADEASASLTDAGPELVRRVVQTLVAVAVLIVMARPAREESDARAASSEPDGSFASGSRALASRSMRSGIVRTEPASGSVN